MKDVRPPMEYLEMCYRKMFGLTPQEFNKMSYKTFLTDMEMLSIEDKMKNGIRQKRNTSHKT